MCVCLGKARKKTDGQTEAKRWALEHMLKEKDSGVTLHRFKSWLFCQLATCPWGKLLNFSMPYFLQLCNNTYYIEHNTKQKTLAYLKPNLQKLGETNICKHTVQWLTYINYIINIHYHCVRDKIKPQLVTFINEVFSFLSQLLPLDQAACIQGGLGFNSYETSLLVSGRGHLIHLTGLVLQPPCLLPITS